MSFDGKMDKLWYSDSIGYHIAVQMNKAIPININKFPKYTEQSKSQKSPFTISFI